MLPSMTAYQTSAFRMRPELLHIAVPRKNGFRAPSRSIDMNKHEIREKFEHHVGSERYRRFLVSVQHITTANGRLKYWQEIAWKQFSAENGLPHMDFAEICSFFQYCEVHQCEFLPDQVEIVYGTMRPLHPAQEAEAARLYPHARTKVRGPCWVETPQVAAVSYCPQCRQALRQKLEPVAER